MWLCYPLFLSNQLPKFAIADVWVEHQLALQGPAEIQPGRRHYFVNTSWDSHHWQTLSVGEGRHPKQVLFNGVVKKFCVLKSSCPVVRQG